VPPPRPFAFITSGTPLAATIHREPADLVEPQPAVIVTGSWLTVKEQMPDLYAAALARLGYTAFTFDFTGFGATGGAPRQVEAATRKIADITAAASAVRSLSFVRPGGLGHLAVCASAQYVLRAIAEGRRSPRSPAWPAGSTTPPRWHRSTAEPRAWRPGWIGPNRRC